MKKLLTITACLALAGEVNAQGCLVWPYGCLDTIPGSAVIITGTENLTQDATCFWVCPEDTLYLTGVNNTVYAEAGSAVVVSGSENFIEMKENGYVEIDTGSLACGVWYESTVTLVDNGPNTQKTVCGDVNFGYGQAPPGGCALGLTEPDTRVLMFPNPTGTLLFISGLEGGTSVELVDVLGNRFALDVRSNGIDVAAFRPGMYWLVAHSGSSVSVHGKLVITN
jgi:hypothetical protein